MVIKKLEVEFNQVKKDFPTPGIWGHTFLYNNQAVVDIFNNTINEKNNSTYDFNETCFKLKPRSETVVSVPIADPKVKNKNILIYERDIMEDVYYASAIITLLLYYAG